MIISPAELSENLMKLKRQKNRRKGLSTGFHELDEYLLLSKQYLMVVTGMPSCGKSEIVDAIACNTALLHNWNWLYFSPENYPLEEHLKKMIERKCGNQLADIPDREITAALEWANQHFAWIHADDQPYSVTDLLCKVEERIFDGHQVDAVVIDPWNELDHSIQGGLRDDQYISKMLTLIRQFHRKHNILTCVVIHPTKLQKDRDGKYPTPTLYDCNGGAMWRNKADFGLCVHRDNMEINSVMLLIQKIKFKSMGRQGYVEFNYDYASGRLKSPSDMGYHLPEPCPF